MNITYNPENENERQVVAVINSAVGEAQAEAGMWSQTPEPVDVETIDDEPQAVSLEAVRERRRPLGVHRAAAREHYGPNEEFRSRSSRAAPVYR